MKQSEAESTTKEEIFKSAQDLMITKGYVATTIEEICDAAGVTKGSFFYYFKNKEALGRELLERFSCNMGSAMKDGVCDCGTDPYDRVIGYIDCTIQMSKHPDAKGCLVGTFSQEISDTHPDLRAICEQSFASARSAFAQEFKKAKELYAPRAAFDPDKLADYFIGLTQGSFIMAKARRDQKVIEENLMQFREYVRFLYGK